MNSGALTKRVTATTAGDYRCRINGDFAITKFTNTVTVSLNAVVTAPTTTPTSTCTNLPALITASGGANGQYRWYTVATGGTPIAGENNATYTTPLLAATIVYYVQIDNGTCASARSSVLVTVVNPPALPTVTSSSSCGPGPVTLTASGGANGQYRWYTIATGGTALTGEVNSSFITPVLTSSTSHYVSITNGSCESARTTVIATINTVPSKAVITSSLPPDNNNTITICNGTVTLSAPAGFSYLWSTGATTQQIAVSQSGNYTVAFTSTQGCSGPVSDFVQVIALANCVNSAPVIDSSPLTTSIESTINVNLLKLVSDADNNLDASSLKIISPPISGAIASIDKNGNLNIDYKGISFSGTDQIIIEACDFFGSCAQQQLNIEVGGDIVIYNAVSPNGDNKNDFLFLQYIELLKETKENQVTIINRWGSEVFEMTNYNNASNVFKGLNNNGSELPSGNYFYKIKFASGRKSETGYFILKR